MLDRRREAGRGGDVALYTGNDDSIVVDKSSDNTYTAVATVLGSGVQVGYEDTFDGGVADFTRMIPGGGVWVDKVLQKSFVRVDEVGTEASAVTGVFVVESAAPTVRFDRPFVLAIRERLCGTVLFLGVVQDPS